MIASAVQTLNKADIRLALVCTSDVGDVKRRHDFVTRLDLLPMDDNDLVMPASAFGILRCLRALAQEASSLQMFRTLSAIEDALDVAAGESGIDCPEDHAGGGINSQLLH